jgi:hypothetical protein
LLPIGPLGLERYLDSVVAEMLGQMVIQVKAGEESQGSA